MTAPNITLLGAHSAMGRALIEVLEERGLDDDVVAATTSEHVEGDLALVDAELLSRTGLAILCDDDPLLATVAGTLGARGIDVIDGAGVLPRGETPLAFPAFLGPEATLRAEGAGCRAVRLPLGMVEPVVAVLGALSHLEPCGLHVVTFESAAVRGRPGMEELSEQTRGIFTMNRAEPSVFRQSLAFACVPSLALGAQSAPSAPSARSAEEAELEFEADVRAGLPPGLRGLDVRATRVLVPSFSSEAAVVGVSLQDTPERSDVVRALEAGRGLRVIPDGVGSTLDAVGRDDVLVSRVRLRPRGLHVFVTADRLRRGSATQAAWLVERWLDNLSLDS